MATSASGSGKMALHRHHQWRRSGVIKHGGGAA